MRKSGGYFQAGIGGLSGKREPPPGRSFPKSSGESNPSAVQRFRSPTSNFKKEALF
jgi:hypothetical protein